MIISFIGGAILLLCDKINDKALIVFNPIHWCRLKHLTINGLFWEATRREWLEGLLNGAIYFRASDSCFIFIHTHCEVSTKIFQYTNSNDSAISIQIHFKLNVDNAFAFYNHLWHYYDVVESKLCCWWRQDMLDSGLSELRWASSSMRCYPPCRSRGWLFHHDLCDGPERI